MGQGTKLGPDRAVPSDDGLNIQSVVIGLHGPVEPAADDQVMA
jgi:hypothetical protein